MSTADCSHTISPGAERSWPAYALALVWFALRQLAWWLRHGIDGALLWTERARQRRQLAGLDDHLLRDIGLSRADVRGEVDKPFWQQ